MLDKFEISLIGELTFFIVLQVRHMESAIFINHVKYTKELLKKFCMKTCSSLVIPMSSSTKEKYKGGILVEITMYRGLIGSLLYLTASRIHIMFLVCIYARFQSDPKKYNFIVVKRTLKYLKGTKKVGLCYPKDYTYLIE